MAEKPGTLQSNDKLKLKRLIVILQMFPLLPRLPAHMSQ
jgi:hypothetical protein